ncbi:hypothetical protein ACFVZD_36725 [Streptomyces sp. NPDC058287]|uniref:hypothetical protein n=1 Tax=Streptomyces sp. NPDC058287 TaxID=3346423 RepID=UPI0036E8E65D
MTNALWLEGWEGQSTWGYDSAAGSYFAQLYRDEGPDRDAPDVWLSGVTERFKYAEELMVRIMAATSASPTAVYEAMVPDPLAVVPQHRAPEDPAVPGGRTLQEIQERAQQADGDTEFEQGIARALKWVLGREPASPVTALPPASARPSPLEIEAERWAATGAIYQPTRTPRDVATGAETALYWVAGRSESL